MKFDIYHKSGKKSSKKATLNDEVFGVSPNDHCVYLAVNSEMAAIRQGTHSSKTRAEVSGSGAKPWRQKGTGRARIGSLRNPSRVHGSKAFGPKPHGLIISYILAWVSFAISIGVSATLNNLGVTRLTLSSVHCADNKTAISKVYGSK